LAGQAPNWLGQVKNLPYKDRAMKKSIIITDLTRMQNNRVCVAGVEITHL
jgi:hypothetical protein